MLDSQDPVRGAHRDDAKSIRAASELMRAILVTYSALHPCLIHK
jgi:hypothetical protein